MHEKQDSQRRQEALERAHKARKLEKDAYEKEEARMKADAMAAHKVAKQRENDIAMLKEEREKMQSEMMLKAEEMATQKAKVPNH
jgi:hypothetical protein